MSIRQIFVQHDQYRFRTKDEGFILPVLVVLSIILMSVGLVALQYVSASTGSIQSSYYLSMAKNAADAGANLAINCIKNNDMNWTLNSTELRPDTNCSGATTSPLRDTLTTSSNGSVQVKFVVKPLSETNQGTIVESKGIVEFRYAGSSVPTRTIESSTKVSIPTTSVEDIRQIAQGTAVTKLRAGGSFSCAIANQSLYCWGRREQGQTGDGANGTSAATAALSSAGSLAGKRISDIDLGQYNGCALSEGKVHCWGANNIGQLGNGGVSGPSLPIQVNGDLAGKNVQKVTLGTSADQVNGSQYTCAIAEAKIYCWGANNYAQLGQAGYDCLPFFGCFQLSAKPEFTTPAYDGTRTLPTPVFGYANRQFENQSQLYNVMPYDVDAGAYGVCAIVVSGRTFCWGNRFVLVPFNDDGGLNKPNGWKYGSLSGKFVQEIGTGESTACAVANGNISCWGARPGDGTNPLFPDGVPRLVPNGSGAPLYGVNVTALDATDDSGPFCLAGNGNAYCWGNTTNTGLSVGQYFPGAATDTVTEVAGGVNYGCFVANGSSYCYGNNGWNSLGNGDPAPYQVNPTKTLGVGLTSGEAATDISTGSDHSCAVINGYIYCWGKNDRGQLGTGNNTARSQPYGIVGITQPKGATSVSAGANHSCGIIDGAAYCWGANDAGQLGDGTTTDKSTPTQIGGLLAGKSVSSISAGLNHTCAVANGAAYCWGNNTNGRLGNNSQTASTTPVAVQGMSGKSVTKIAVGDTFSCAIADQKAYCWGNNASGQIGRAAAPNVGGQQLTATPVDALSSSVFTDITAGSNFTCATVNGYAHCWGDNSNGQLGRSSTTANQWQALRVASPVDGKNTDQISAGDTHACSITNGVAYCWGTNTNGKLGDGTTTQRNTPVAVTASPTSLGTNYPYRIDAGGSHTCAVANGKITCWGAGINGQLGTGMPTSQILTPSSWTENYIRTQKVLDFSRMVSF